MSDAVQFDLGPLSITVGATRRGRTELRVRAFDQDLGSITTTGPAELEALLSAETEQLALFELFKDHCAPLLRQQAQRGPASTQTLCIRLAHPCDNPQCDAVHELLCLNSANTLLARAAANNRGSDIPFTVVDEEGHPLSPVHYLDEASTELLLLDHVAPALVEMASFFSPACMEAELSRWQPPSPSDQDIVSYFGFFAGMPDALYGIFQYINPLLLSIWMERINTCIDHPSHDTKAAAQAAWFTLLARLHILPADYLASAQPQADTPLARISSPAGSHRLH